MAKQGRAPKPVPDGQLQFSGTSDVSAVYSDAFLVATEGDTNMGNLYFYQRVLADSRATLGETAHLKASKARCVGRIVMPAMAIEKLLAAMAENRGFTLVRKSTPAKAEK